MKSGIQPLVAAMALTAMAAPDLFAATTQAEPDDYYFPPTGRLPRGLLRPDEHDLARIKAAEDKRARRALKRMGSKS